MVQLLRKKEKKIEIEALKPEDYDLKLRKDRVGKYFKKYTKDFVFDQFNDAYFKKYPNIEFMRGVPIPLRKQDVDDFAGGEGLKLTHITENMAWIIGIDPKFKHIEKYMQLMEGMMGKKVAMALVKEGRDAAEKQEYEDAAIHLRAALCIEPQNMHALYSYARVCRELYLSSSDEAFVGNFKAESIEFFEILVHGYPSFAQGYYYLGYAYLNLGLYVKAKLTWQDYLKKSTNSKDKREIKKRISQLEKPVKIEEGYNAVLAGRYELGIEILEPFLNTDFKDWWPMSYYIGIAYLKTGKRKDALDSFKRVLTINPSHVESMDELAKIYAESDDKENETKYRKKAELIRKGGH